MIWERHDELQELFAQLAQAIHEADVARADAVLARIRELTTQVRHATFETEGTTASR